MDSQIENPLGDQNDLPPNVRLTVVFAARGHLSNLQKALECLLLQTDASSIEFILTTDSPSLLQEVKSFVRSRRTFAKTLFLLDAVQDLPSARLRAAAEATSGLLAFAEDHCFQESNWAEELLAVFDSSPQIIAAAPVILNPNQDSAVSRAQFVLTHGMLELGPHRNRIEDCKKLPWHSTVYRRVIFMAAACDVGLLQAESLLQEEIQARNPDARFVRCAQTSLRHVNMSRLVPAMRHAFHGGKIFGAERAKRHRWGWCSRLVRSLLFPQVGILKFLRCSPILLDQKSLTRTLANFLAAFPLSLSHALGEALGTVFGKGLSAQIYTTFDCNRSSLLRSSERDLLFSDIEQGEAEARSQHFSAENFHPCK